MNDATLQAAPHDRRAILKAVGASAAMAGGLSLLSACKDDVQGAEAVPQPTPSATASPVSAPTFTPNDADRLNAALQFHYLLAAYFQRGVSGTTLPAALATGAGVAGGVSGGAQVTLGDANLAASLREVTANTTGRLLVLRRLSGTSVTAQPAINIAGGQGSPFDAISQRALAAGATQTTFFDPYASENDFLLGAMALLAVTTTALNDIAWQLGAGLRGSIARIVAGIAADNAIVRNAIFARANAQPRTMPTGQISLFERANIMSDGRDRFDGPARFDFGVGGWSGNDWVNSNILPRDGNSMAFRRTVEQALNIFYNTANVAQSGGFFPAGVNGTMRYSGNSLF